MNDLAKVTAFAKRYAEAWCSLVTRHSSLVTRHLFTSFWKIDNAGLIAESVRRQNFEAIA